MLMLITKGKHILLYITYQYLWQYCPLHFHFSAEQRVCGHAHLLRFKIIIQRKMN